MVDAKVVIGNPVKQGGGGVPSAPVPSQVGRPLPEQAAPIAKPNSGMAPVEGGDSPSPSLDLSGGVDEELLEKLDADADAQPKGVISIKIFENSPYEVDFSGIVTGSELDMAWRAMMKEYRVWKHTMFRKLEQDKKDGGV